MYAINKEDYIWLVGHETKKQEETSRFFPSQCNPFLYYLKRSHDGQ